MDKQKWGKKHTWMLIGFAAFLLLAFIVSDDEFHNSQQTDVLNKQPVTNVQKLNLPTNLVTTYMITKAEPLPFGGYYLVLYAPEAKTFLHRAHTLSQVVVRKSSDKYLKIWLSDSPKIENSNNGHAIYDNRDDDSFRYGDLLEITAREQGEKYTQRYLSIDRNGKYKYFDKVN